MKITNLKQAQQDPKAMKQFVAEHEGDQIESDDFDKVMTSMLGSETPRVIQAASKADDFCD